jgi:hypothetical protein
MKMPAMNGKSRLYERQIYTKLQSRRTFRIFVSSTFSDLVAERSALQERVSRHPDWRRNGIDLQENGRAGPVKYGTKTHL